MYKRHLKLSEVSEHQNHSEVLYLNLLKKTNTCVVAKPLVYIILIEQTFCKSEFDINQKLSIPASGLWGAGKLGVVTR